MHQQLGPMKKSRNLQVQQCIAKQGKHRSETVLMQKQLGPMKKIAKIQVQQCIVT
jgi:hypothetical protein